MVFIVRDAEKLNRLDPSRKVIKAADFWAFKKAEETIADAMKKHDEIVNAAQAAYEAEQRRGYQEGVETAKLEQAAKMEEVLAQSADYVRKVEKRMVELVFDAVRHVIGQFDQRELVVVAVQHALQAVRSQKQLVLRVHPEQVEAVRARLDEMLQLFPAIEFVDVVADMRLDADACVVESEIGIVEASVSGQLQALHETFAKVFGTPS